MGGEQKAFFCLANDFSNGVKARIDTEAEAHEGISSVSDRKMLDQVSHTRRGQEDA